MENEKNGVGQGRMLSPLLFFVYRNDLLNVVYNYKM